MTGPTQGRGVVPGRLSGDVDHRPSHDAAALAEGLGDVAMEALAQRVADLVVDRLVDVLAQRDAAPEPPTADVRLVDAAELAELLGRSRDWVYRRARAGKLAAIREGDGARPRLLFDPVAVLASLGSRESSERSSDPDGRRSPAGTRDRGAAGAPSTRRRRGAGATTTRSGVPLLPIRGGQEIAA